MILEKIEFLTVLFPSDDLVLPAVVCQVLELTKLFIWNM